MGDQETWQSATRRRRKTKRPDWRTTIYAHSHDTFTFYIGNLAGNISAGDIWREFKVFGNLVDVFLPKRKDHRGARFAFIRYEHVKDRTKVEQVLNSVILKGKKIQANLEKFDKDRRPARLPSGETVGQMGVMNEDRTKKENQHLHCNMATKTGERSFKDALVGASSSTKTLEFHKVKSVAFSQWEKTSLLVK